MLKNQKYKISYLKYFLLYLIFFIPVSISFVIGWYFLIDGVFYYCGDKLPFLDLIPPFIHGTNYGDYFIAPPFIVYTTWIVTLTSSFILPWILLKDALRRNFRYTKILLFSSLVTIILVSLMFTTSTLCSTSLPPSNPPDWDNPSAVYMIGKKHHNYVVHYEIEGAVGEYFIGISQIDLAPFIERKVIIEGNFPKNNFDLNERTTNMQCIQGICHLIFTPKFWENKNQTTPVIDIDRIELITE